MEGVQILNQFEVVTSYNPDPIVGFVILCIVFMLTLLVVCVTGTAGGDTFKGLKLGAIMGAILGLLFGIVAPFCGICGRASWNRGRYSFYPSSFNTSEGYGRFSSF